MRFGKNKGETSGGIRMKKWFLFTLSVAFLASCSSAGPSSSRSESSLRKYMAEEMRLYRYSTDPSDPIFLYWGFCSFPPEVRGELTDSLLPGDYVTLASDTSQILVPASIGAYPYPAQGDEFFLYDILYAEVVEITFDQGVPKGEGLSFDAMNLKEDYAYTKDLTPVPFAELEKGYAMVSAKEKGKVRAIYVENPRP